MFADLSIRHASSAEKTGSVYSLIWGFAGDTNLPTWLHQIAIGPVRLEWVTSRLASVVRANARAMRFYVRASAKHGTTLGELLERRALVFIAGEGYRLNDGSERIRSWWQRMKWTLAALPGLDGYVVDEGNPYFPTGAVRIHLDRSAALGRFLARVGL